MKAAADQGCFGMYRKLVLLLRSLRACSLGVVLAKVARCLCIYPEAARSFVGVSPIYTVVFTQSHLRSFIYVVDMGGDRGSLRGHFLFFFSSQFTE